MYSLEKIIKNYFPEEQILVNKTINFQELKIPKVGKLPLIPIFAWYPNVNFKSIPNRHVEMIETNKRYYIDTRTYWVPQYGNARVYIKFLLISPILIVLSFLLKLNFVLVLSIFISVGAILYYLLLLVNESIFNVQVYDKSWITNKKLDGGSLKLEGDLPRVSNYTLNYFFDHKNRKDLPFLEKLIEKVYFNKLLMNSLIKEHFTISISDQETHTI